MLKTACHDWHVAHGARMVDFAGWEMPVQYTTIRDEHHAVRNQAGLFDIAHMGRILFIGQDATSFLSRLLTVNVEGLPEGKIRYALVTNAEGGILDDVLVYRFSDSYLLVVNASNRTKIVDWIRRQIGSERVHVVDDTADQFMLALQGPSAEAILTSVVSVPVSELAYYQGMETTLLNSPAIISRTGYTGEDGFEVVLPVEKAPEFWKQLMDAGQSHGLVPAGLGCRDTLRLESAMPLYGHELDETIDPFTAGLKFAVDLDDRDFIGKEALQQSRENSERPRRVGLVIEGRRIAREGAELFSGSENVGRVTSGTFSPTLEKSIAMAYVDPSQASVGTKLEVDIRGKRESASVVKLPFYRRA